MQFIFEIKIFLKNTLGSFAVTSFLYQHHSFPQGILYNNTFQVNLMTKVGRVAEKMKGFVSISNVLVASDRNLNSVSF